MAPEIYEVQVEYVGTPVPLPLVPEIKSVQEEYAGYPSPLPVFPQIKTAQSEYAGHVSPLPALPKIFSEQSEYAGHVSPLPALPKIFSEQIEYTGHVFPLPALPKIFTFQIEYKYQPLNSGLLYSFDGDVKTIFSIAVDGNTLVPSRVFPSDVLAIPEVSGNSFFNAANKWDYVVVQYLQRTAYDVFNVIHRFDGVNFVGVTYFHAALALGTYVERSILIKAKTSEELILLPTNFDDGHRIIIIP